MRINRLVLPLALLLAADASAQKKKTSAGPAPAATQQPAADNKLAAFVNDLAQKLKSDPTNPLKVNATTLQDVAAKLPDGNLKLKLLDYSTRLTTDADLSTRQVYWDMMQALNTNGTTAATANYLETKQSLDVLFNRSGLLVRALKGDVKDVNAATFLSDPQFISSLAKITGNNNAAMGLAAGLGTTLSMVSYFKEEKKWKQEYGQLLALSKATSTSEMDANLAPGLMASHVGEQQTKYTPVFRYELASGITIAPEKNSMYWYSKDRSQKKQLKNGYPSFISADEKYLVFDLKTLHEAETMKEIIDYKVYPRYNLSRVEFLPEGIRLWSAYASYHGYCPYEISYTDRKYKFRNNETYVIPTDDAQFDFNGTKYKWRKPYSMGAEPPGKVYLAEFPGVSIGLFRASSDQLITLGDIFNPEKSDKRPEAIYTSSFLQVVTKGKKDEAGDRYSNRIAAIVSGPDQKLYVAGANGTFFLLDGTGARDAASFHQLLDAGLAGKPLVEPYNWTEETPPQMFNARIGTTLFSLPNLMLTPDDKLLVYVIKDRLFVAEAAHPEAVRSFQLIFKATGSFFGKENGSYTLHLQGTNEFGFPVTRKYDLNTLLKMYGRAAADNAALPGLAADPVKAKGTGASPAGSSIADEIAKLKKLLDDGVITQQEFEKGKKKILDKN